LNHPSDLGVKRDDLIRTHQGVVRKLAWHVHARIASAIEVEELMQIGLVALVEAADSFEDRGFQFATYATMRIKGAMIDALRRSSNAPRSAPANRRKLDEARRAVEATTHRSARSSEIAAYLAMSASDVAEMERDARPVAHVAIEDSYDDSDLRFASEEPDAFDLLDRASSGAALHQAIDGLPEREKLILQLYFFEEMNLQEIGLTLGVTPGRVCQLKGKAMATLAEVLRED